MYTGVIRAHGEGGHSGMGGASGGSIILKTGTIYGAGKIQVNGGKGQ